MHRTSRIPTCGNLVPDPISTTGLALGRDKARWEEWLEGEREWWETESRREIGSLGSQNSEKVLRVINTLASHRIYRDAVTQGLLPRLKDTNPRIRLATVQALLQLGSPDAQRPLIDALPDDDQAVCQAAHEALKTMSGLDLPPDPTAWREALRTR